MGDRDVVRMNRAERVSLVFVSMAFCLTAVGLIAISAWSEKRQHAMYAVAVLCFIEGISMTPRIVRGSSTNPRLESIVVKSVIALCLMTIAASVLLTFTSSLWYLLTAFVTLGTVALVRREKYTYARSDGHGIVTKT